MCQHAPGLEFRESVALWVFSSTVLWNSLPPTGHQTGMPDVSGSRLTANMFAHCFKTCLFRYVGLGLNYYCKAFNTGPTNYKYCSVFYISFFILFWTLVMYFDVLYHSIIIHFNSKITNLNNLAAQGKKLILPFVVFSVSAASASFTLRKRLICFSKMIILK